MEVSNRSSQERWLQVGLEEAHELKPLRKLELEWDCLLGRELQMSKRI